MNSSSDYDMQIPFLQSFTYGTGVNQKTKFDIIVTNASVAWVFKQIAIENLNGQSANTTVSLYLNNVLLAPSSFMSPTPFGLGVAASGQPYTILQPSDVLTIYIQGATNGDEIKVQGLYTEIKRQ